MCSCGIFNVGHKGFPRSGLTMDLTMEAPALPYYDLSPGETASLSNSFLTAPIFLQATNTPDTNLTVLCTPAWVDKCVLFWNPQQAEIFVLLSCWPALCSVLQAAGTALMCSQTSWLLPLLMGTRVFREINSKLDHNRGCGVEDWKGVWGGRGVALHCILFTDGWLTPLRKIWGWRHHYQRGFPPVNTWGGDGKQTLGSRLMTARRQTGFGSSGALFTTMKSLCLTGFQVLHRCKIWRRDVIPDRQWWI